MVIPYLKPSLKKKKMSNNLKKERINSILSETAKKLTDEEMNVDDLLKKITDLEERLNHEQQSSNHWYREHNKVKENFNKYKNAIQSVVAFLDLTDNNLKP